MIGFLKFLFLRSEKFVSGCRGKSLENLSIVWRLVMNGVVGVCVNVDKVDC